jgi:hypothetical protein
MRMNAFETSNGKVAGETPAGLVRTQRSGAILHDAGRPISIHSHCKEAAVTGRSIAGGSA